MTNQQIAQFFNDYADLLEIAEENTFKIRSYRRAMETIEGLGRELASIHAAGQLETLPGIGKGLAAGIIELLETGELSQMQEMLNRFPASLLELVRIPGFGPKHAGMVFRELGIATVEQLEAAAKGEQLRSLKGMGAKSEEKILRGIDLLREAQERTLLGIALPLASEMLETLRKHPGVIRAEVAGSCRRGRETIGDLDLLSISANSSEVCGYFARTFGTESGNEIIVSGDTKVSLHIEPGINVDLRCVPPESFGAALLYFTGSKQHNVDLRERAQRQGLTLNEYGLYEETNGERGKLIAGATEEEIYQALGLDWIAPELREARGEITAAEAHTLPHLLELKDIRCDMQMHTTGSDGRQTLEVMARACMALGYSHMAVTDHSPALMVANGQTGDRLQAQIDEINVLNEKFTTEGLEFRILAGIEADIFSDGRLDIPDGCYEQLDIVLGSIHQGFSSDPDKVTPRVLAAMESGKIDILAHPTGRLLLERDPFGLHLEQVFEAAVKYDVALEINANPHRLDLNDLHSRRALELGAKLTINTDAHHADHLHFMQYGVTTARRAWATAPAVINTWALADLQNWLQRRRQNIK